MSLLALDQGSILDKLKTPKKGGRRDYKLKKSESLDSPRIPISNL